MFENRILPKNMGDHPIKREVPINHQWAVSVLWSCSFHVVHAFQNCSFMSCELWTVWLAAALMWRTACSVSTNCSSSLTSLQMPAVNPLPLWFAQGHGPAGFLCRRYRQYFLAPCSSWLQLLLFWGQCNHCVLWYGQFALINATFLCVFLDIKQNHNAQTLFFDSICDIFLEIEKNLIQSSYYLLLKGVSLGDRQRNTLVLSLVHHRTHTMEIICCLNLQVNPENFITCTDFNTEVPMKQILCLNRHSKPIRMWRNTLKWPLDLSSK